MTFKAPNSTLRPQVGCIEGAADMSTLDSARDASKAATTNNALCQGNQHVSHCNIQIPHKTLILG